MNQLYTQLNKDVLSLGILHGLRAPIASRGGAHAGEGRVRVVFPLPTVAPGIEKLT